MIDTSASAASLQVIRLPKVLQMTGLCRSTIYQLEAEEKFPRRVQLAPRAVGWVEHEIQGWLAKRIEDRGRSAAT